MIYSSLSQTVNRTYLPKPVQRAVAHIESLIQAKGFVEDGQQDLGLVPGRYEIEGQNMYYLVQQVETSAPSERRPESHTQYVDVQFLLRGEESIGIAKRKGLQVSSKNPGKDVMHYDTDIPRESFIHMRPGEFCVFFPDDVHRPLCSCSKHANRLAQTGGRAVNRQVDKIVVKIHLNLFAE